MTIRQVSSFFNENAAFYDTYLSHTNQKEVTGKYIALALKDLPAKREIRVLCIGGGSGEGDLSMINNLGKRLLPRIKIGYVDPSAEMYKRFINNAKMLGLDGKIDDTHIGKFESAGIKPKPADVVLVLNSIYFIKGWINGGARNPLKKIYSLINPGGVCVMLIRAENSPHTKLKKLAGGGKTTGKELEAALKKAGIPFYTEHIGSRIDVTSCIGRSSDFIESDDTYRLFSFMFGDRWKSMSSKKRKALIEEMDKLAIAEKGRRYINTDYEIVWVKKNEVHSAVTAKPSQARSKAKLSKKLKGAIKLYNDFPVKGIVFRDTTTVLRNAKLFNEVIEYARERYKDSGIDFCVAKDMQALIWAGAIAHALGCGMVPMFRKDLAGDVITSIYEHEYNSNRVVNLQKKAIKPGQKVLLVDYILATGETMRTMAMMVEHLGGTVAGIFSVAELAYLNPRRGLDKYEIESLVEYK